MKNSNQKFLTETLFFTVLGTAIAVWVPVLLMSLFDMSDGFAFQSLWVMVVRIVAMTLAVLGALFVLYYRGRMPALMVLVLVGLINLLAVPHNMADIAIYELLQKDAGSINQLLIITAAVGLSYFFVYFIGVRSALWLARPRD